jgi:DNA-binding CsgD family transcriptional regulator
MLLLQAELARVSGHAELAEARYDEAIREAREQGHPQVISLAGELAASHYRRRGLYKSAIAYLELALEGYAQWGVPLKSKQLKALLSSWEKEKSADPAPGKEQLPTGRESAASTVDTASSPADTATADSFDLTALLRTTQAISKQMDMDTVLAEIMSTLLQHAGASKGAMLTESQDTLRIQAYADVETRAVPFPSELQDSTLLPEGIIRYVFRTQENVHYNGGEASWLNHNPYMAKHRPQSALCVPITVHGTMLGVLYLENRLADGVFVSDRMAVLLAIASQGMLMCVLQSANETTYSGPGLEDETSPSPGRMEEPLTERELEVLSLLAAGLTNKEISDRLIIAVGTVKVHVKNIFAKLKVNRRFKAIEQAKELRLLGQDEQRS